MISLNSLDFEISSDASFFPFSHMCVCPQGGARLVRSWVCSLAGRRFESLDGHLLPGIYSRDLPRHVYGKFPRPGAHAPQN